MTTKHNNPNEEDRLAELLRAAGRSELPPDGDFLARLREQTSEAFQASATIDTRNVSTQSVGTSHNTKRKSKMILLAGRVLAATAAVAVATAAWFMAQSDARTLSQVLEQTENADALHFRIVAGEKDAKPAEAWCDKAKSLRVNHADGTYDVARGERVWKIDEKSNRAASGPSPYYEAATKTLDLLPLLDAKGAISPKIRQNLRTIAVRPVREKNDAEEFDVYRFEATDVSGPIVVEARVNAATKLLHSLETLVDRDGRRTPIATLTVLGINQPVDESLFVVGDTLTEDGRIGKVTDVQGVVAVKPVMAERWTPVCGNILLMPGDWVQTEPRGANAVAAHLAGKTQIVAGPGTLVELSTPKQVRLFSGDIKIAVEKDDSAPEGRNVPLQLIGPGNERLDVNETGVYRVVKEKLVRLDESPKWLKGFEGNEVQESLGSLVANIDGRNEPLTVGYHKVSVEIRDQIARTTVEESFANHTDRRLEGVFYFPLPQDASISGFGMWIGNELVEADIVEKQRAREIYEQILRENRDPGLLEWTGGNVFKARVFPIEAHAEKRIKIVYTQVLPLAGNKFRYSYALQSEMLKLHPLRELSIDVKLNSAVPLKDVTSPTHMVRSDRTAHSAHVEFAAKEYTPNRDFEVVAELDGKQSEITLIPHRRGEDGYFMLMFAPPASEAQDDRDLLVSKEPLDVLFLADTSASLDESQRTRQAEFLAAMLKSLTPRDRFNLACMDVECDWAFEKATAADEKNIEAARQFLDRRMSLGWTDLEKAFASAFERAGKGTRIIYIGDGIPTVGDGEAAGVSARLVKLFEEKCRGKGVVCYTVSSGSTFESGVLKTIAGLGGGSMRQITGEQGPRVVAFDLLKEITRPAISNLKVQFSGVRVARVYPEQLPNLSAGSQQIMLGRYLPQGAEQSGEIVVSGRQGEKDVQFKRAITIKDAEEGNSFIPRLWARMHLDHLLQQGPSESIKDDIIALSEEYHIITPYTSLLVLETDADRERFKVKRSFQMRDGEKFFAERRDNTNFELVQQQMKRAGTWRLGLRKSVLQQLSGLGRDANVIPQPQVYSWPHQVNTEHYRRLGVNIRGGNGRWADLGVQGLIIERLAEDGVDTLGRNNRLANSNLAYQGEDFDSRIDLFTSLVTPDPSLGYQFARSPSMEQAEEREQFFGLSEFTGVEKKREFTIAGGTELAQPEFDGRFGISRLEVRKLGQEGLADVQFSMGDVIYADRKFRQLERGYQEQFGYDGASEGAERVNYDVCKRVYETHGKEVCYTVCQPVWDTTRSRFVMVDRRRVRPSGVNLDGLFGWLPSVEAVKTTPPKAKDWPEEARTISKNLLRTAQLQSADGGLKIASEMQAFDPRFGDVIAKCRGEFLTGAKSWLLCLENDGQPMTIEWCDGRERAVMTAAFQLGRVRGTVAEDLKMPPWQDGSFALWSLEERFAEQKVAIEHPTADQTLLIFTHPDDKTGETRVLVDTKRNVVLSIEHRRDGKTTDVHTFSDFVEAAGAWWVGKIESRDEKGRVVGVKTQRVARLEGDALAKAIESELAGREKAQFLRDPARNVIEAKKALKENKADFDDQVTLVMHFAFSQQWTRAMEHLDAAEKLAAGKPGMRWLRYQLLKASRRNEELKNAILKEAEELIGKPVPGPVPDDDLILHLRSDYSELAHPRADAWYLDNYLLGQASGVLENNERLTMLDTLRPVFAAQPEYRLAMKQWKQQRADLLGNCGRGDEALLLIRELAESYPRDFGAQMKYLQAMQGRQEFALVRKEIERRLASDVPWEPEEIYQFRSMFADTLRAEERYEELTGYLKQWIEQNPDRNEPYYQYLDALLYVDRVEDAYALSETWFEDGRRNDVAPAAAARVWAAAMWILADNHWNGYGTGKDRSFWERQLSETVVFFARHEKLFSLSEWIIHNNEFWQTEAGVKARAQRRKIFEENFDRLSVAEIERFVGWLPNEGSDAEKQIWKGYARRLEERALAETDVERKYRLLKAAGNFVAYCGNSGEYIAMLRKIVAEVPEKHRGEFISLLFDTLLNQAWSQDYENEAFELLDKLQKGATPAEQTIERIRALHRIDDRMLQTRREAKNAAIEHPEKLTRTELAAKQAENARKAMEEYAERLAREEAKHPAPLATWMAAERVWLDVQLNRNLEQAAEFCWKTLDAKLPTIDENSAAAAVVQAAIDHALRNRCLVMAMNLTVRKNSAPQAIRRLMDFLDQNIAREIAEDTKSQQWKLLKYEMLIALDRPAELEKTLDEWIRAGDADNRWRTALGYVQAEQGKLKEAIATFEAVKAADELGSAEYRALGDWYQAENRREDYEKSKEQIYKTMPEGEIEQFLNGQMQPWLNPDGARPSELNREVLWAFQNVLAKSGDPARFIGGPLRSLYGACRDFRLLASLADSVPGHTAGQIYPFLRSARTVIDEIRDEAAVDSLTARIVELRGKAATEVDRRAFDLLEAMVERRASELKNQPGPHVEKAVAALRQASKREWSAGEQRLMAEFLADLGVVNQEKFSAEQMRQIEQFYLSAKAGSQERLDMACIWARSLWGHGRRQAAIDVLESEVRQYLPPTGEANTPGTANYRKRLSDQPIFADYLSYLQQEGQFETAVNQVQAQLDRETAEAKRNDLTIQIFEVERAALRDGGHVAGFEGEKLYRRLQEEILARLPSGNSPFDARLITTLSALYSEAHNRQIAAAAGDLRTYAFGKFHELLKRQIAQNEALVNDLCERVHQLCGPADGIAFLLDCRDRRPRWLRIRQNFWDAHGSQLTAWRKEAGKLDPALTERLLAVVLEQLRDGLLGRHGYNLPICYDNCPAAFWAEKEGDFLRTAEEVYAANENSAPIILNVADYLVQGLSRLDRAIEMLRAANDEKLLDENGQLRLVDYLQRRDRYGESIALLQSLVERSPHNLDYCGRLIAAYFYTNRRADLFELLRKTEDWFRTHDGWHWNEDTMAITAESCVQCNGGDPDLRRDLLAQALKYYEVLIPLHERNHPQLGAADGQLSHYYSNKSKCYAVLKKTFEAADAAYSAVVCWGPDANNRKAALETLRNVLRGADDLDAYVVKLDEQSAKAGQQNAVVRKALGQVFAERGQYDKAMVQLRIACDVQPDDREIRQAMIDCCDRLKDKHEAIAQVIELVKLARRDINLYKDLGRRFADLNDAHESERAYTSIVEVLASEAESHAMLAEVRESQNRFAEAIAEWRQVARLRALEPTGLLRLARAQIHEKQWKDAAETLRQLGAKVWPPRFDKLDAEILELKFKIWGGQGSETR